VVSTAERVAVIVGLGGIGVATARRLGAGATVLLADVDPAAVNDVAATLRADGYDVVGRVTDITEPASVAELATKAREIGPVDVFVHTAGVSPTQASVEAILRVDLLGTALLLDSFATEMAPTGAGVVIASMAGSLLPPDPDLERRLAATPTADLLALPELSAGALSDPGMAYAIAKRGNQLRVRAAAIAWGRAGARINSISPGVIATPMSAQELASPNGEGMRQMLAVSPCRRIGTSADIAAAAEFLTGAQATYITGINLLVDGGVVAALTSGS
jgi:NAD(P)-dependent dehydrogenase (short-subunit alcohol dehydrogenase family)